MRLIKIKAGEYKGETGVVISDDGQHLKVKLKDKPDPIKIKRKFVRFLKATSWVIDKILLIIKLF